jgi:hypothetical protein
VEIARPLLTGATEGTDLRLRGIVEKWEALPSP